MNLSFQEILKFLKESNLVFDYNGDENLIIEDFCSLNNLKKNSITWIKNIEKFNLESIDKTLNLLIVTNVNSTVAFNGYNIITCINPKEVFFSILTRFFQPQNDVIIENTSTVLTDKIGKNVSIGHNCFICKDVTIDDNVIIKHNVVIDCKATIGCNSTINSGVIIGAEGFGYFKSQDNYIHNVPHFGGVRIGKFVDIGANTCIDRGTIDDTIIEDHVKIDNLCHIAHNVHIKENSFVIALSMLGGSCTLEKDSYIAPGAMVMNQITVGENSLVGMGAVVTKNVIANKVVAGVPAKVIRENK